MYPQPLGYKTSLNQQPAETQTADNRQPTDPRSADNPSRQAEHDAPRPRPVWIGSDRPSFTSKFGETGRSRCRGGARRLDKHRSWSCMRIVQGHHHRAPTDGRDPQGQGAQNQINRQHRIALRMIRSEAVSEVLMTRADRASRASRFYLPLALVAS